MSKRQTVHKLAHPAYPTEIERIKKLKKYKLSPDCLLYTSPSPRDGLLSRMPSSA